MVRFEVSTLAHAVHVADNLRRGDYTELLYSSGRPRSSCIESVRTSEFAWTMLDDAGPIAIFGVAEECWDTGVPWMLGVPRVVNYQRALIEHGRKYVVIMNKLYPHLHNYVHASNHVSIRWLNVLGFTFGDVVPHYGVGRKPFIHFYRHSDV